MIFRYARISTKHQNLDMQIDERVKSGIASAKARGNGKPKKVSF